MSNQASEDELEQHLLNDKAFQHILKLAPKSQRELMTFELARYIDALIRNEKLKLLDKIVGLSSNKQFKDYTKQDIASFFSRLGELERELEAEL